MKKIITFILFALLILPLEGQGILRANNFYTGSACTFPKILSGTQKGVNTQAYTSTTAEMPIGTQEGDLIVVLLSVDGRQQLTINTAYSGSNWTIEDQDTSLSGPVTGAVIWKIAEGSDLLKVNHGNEESTHISFRVSCYNADNPLTVTSAVGLYATIANSPSNIGEYGAKNYLWVIAEMLNDDYYPNATPDTFSGLDYIIGDAVGSAATAMATREFNTADAFDPAAWSNTGTPGWVAFTIIINPL